MLPASESERNMMRKKGISPRQAARRRIKYEDLHQNKKAKEYPLGSVIATFGNKSKAVRGDASVSLVIPDDDIYNIGIEDLQHILELIKSPLANITKDGFSSNAPLVRSAPHKMLHFGLWMNNVVHYSGGRVHLMLLAYNLANMGHKVTVVTDNMPRFLNDFKYMEVEDRIEFLSDTACLKTNWLLKSTVNNIDVVIATPRIYEAFQYSKKWNIPCYAFLLETPNYVSKFRGGPDSTEAYWSEYKHCIKNHADFILCNPGPTMIGAQEWLPDFKGKFFEAPPPINTSAADKVEVEEENEICFVGRHLDFKCPDDVIFAVSNIPEEDRPKINFVGSHNQNVRMRLTNKARPLGVDIQFYAGVDDYEKFHIIKRSKLMVIPTKFEGFGMPPAEALYCKKPVVVYELPITRFIYGDSLNYVAKGDVKALGLKIRDLLSNPKKRIKQGLAGFKDMYSPTSNIPCLSYKVQKNLRNIFYGKNNLDLTAGIIALNAGDTLKVCLQSIYDSVDSIIIVEGAVEDYAKQSPELHESGHSIDDTFEIIANFPDPLGKIELVTIEDVYNRKLWKNKNEMQNEIAKRIKTPLYLKVDADEIWKNSDIEYCRRIFLSDPQLTVMYMQRWHFWKDLKTVAVGGQWDSSEARMWRWEKGFCHTMEDKKGFNYLVDKTGRKVIDPNYKVIRIMRRMHFHLGYCRDDEHIRGKIKYYANRGIECNVKDNYSDWKEGQPTNSTHPDGTTATKFKGSYPNVLKKAFHKKLEVEPKQCVQNNLGMLNAVGN